MDTTKPPNSSSGKHPFLPRLFCLWRKAKKTSKNSKLPSPSSGEHPFLPNLFSLRRKAKKTNNYSPPWQRLNRRFTFKELRTATDNFQLRINQGGFSEVYKGFISYSYKDMVVIKRFESDHPQQRLFLREMELLSSLRHQNIVSLIGYCLDGSESNKFIVYESMPRGTLHDQLHSKNDSQPPLSWKKRLEICIGAARGLEFLHTSNPSFVHGDIKSSSILLDHNWVAKITNFGFSKLVPTSLSKADSHVSTPGHLESKKSDVFWFGGVLFEVLSDRKLWDIDIEEKQWANLIRWCRHCMEDGRLDDIVDPRLRDEVPPECLKAYADIAYKCTNERRNERPTIDVVVKRLQLTLLLQECIEADIPFSPSWLRSIVRPPKRTEPLQPLLEMQPLVEMEIQDSEESAESALRAHSSSIRGGRRHAKASEDNASKTEKLQAFIKDEVLVGIYNDVFPCTAEQFYNLILSDDSSFTNEYRSARKDTNLTMGQWHAADEYDGQVREITFRSICNSPMCPPDTAMTEYQHSVLSEDKKKLVFETVQQAHDVPFGSYFEVHCRWCVEANGENSSVLDIKVGAHFKKWCVMQSKIKSDVINEKQVIPGYNKAFKDFFVDCERSRYKKEVESMLDIARSNIKSHISSGENPSSSPAVVQDIS